MGPKAISGSTSRQKRRASTSTATSRERWTNSTGPFSGCTSCRGNTKSSFTWTAIAAFASGCIWARIPRARSWERWNGSRLATRPNRPPSRAEPPPGGTRRARRSVPRRAKAAPLRPSRRQSAPPAADAQGATLMIRVQPAEADVLIDGEGRRGPDGDDRLLVQVTEGRHHIEVRKEGYDPSRPRWTCAEARPSRSTSACRGHDRNTPPAVGCRRVAVRHQPKSGSIVPCQRRSPGPRSRWPGSSPR